MKKIESKPCSVCGGRRLVYRTVRTQHWIKRYMVCSRCGANSKSVQAVRLLPDVRVFHLCSESSGGIIEAVGTPPIDGSLSGLN